MRFRKKEDEKKDEKKEEGKGEDDKDADDKRDFKLDDDVMKYFYESYQSHIYDVKMTWGDLFRLFKYYIRFSKWDSAIGTRTFRVYPVKLTTS